GMVEGPVPPRVDGPQTLTRELGALGLHTDEHGPTHDADPLRRHPDPDMAGAHDLFVQAGPVGAGGEAAADVEPLDDDSAAERRSVGGSPHHHARPVGRVRVGRERPATVAGELTVRHVGRGRSRGGALVLDIPAGGEVDGRSLADEDTAATATATAELSREVGRCVAHECSTPRMKISWKGLATSRADTRPPACSHRYV